MFINLVNDFLLVIVLGFEKLEKNIMNKFFRYLDESILVGGILKVVVIRGCIIGVVIIIV